MTFPSFVFSLVVATFIGAGFHLWKGGGFGKLLLFIILSWFGFFGGNYFAQLMDWNVWVVGSINLGFSIIFSLAFLIIGHWLSTSQIEE